MSDPVPLRRPTGLAAPTSICTPASTGSTAPSSSIGSSKSFGAKSLQRKRPVGLSIDKAIDAARAAPAISLEDHVSDAEQLRQDIAKLQLSSRSTDSESNSYDSPTHSPTQAHGRERGHGHGAGQPLTPTTLNQSDSSSSGKKKSKDKEGGKKRSKTDKDAQELVKNEDLEVLNDLGSGNGGTVTKVWNRKRKCIMARKLILVDAKPSVRKQILRELQIMNDCNSPFIVGYYGCFPADVHVGVVMEYMDAGSLDYIYRRNGAIPVQIVGKVAEAVLKGLMYLYDVHRIIHRDIKPSNILANTAGQIKICDFGVSGELINSIANTFVGTSTYMSPERIQGAPYTIKSDVWSLGISLIELATGRFPFQDSSDDADSDDANGDGDGDGSDGEREIDEYDPDPTLPISTRRPDLSELQSRNKLRHRRRNKGVSLGGGGHTMSILDLLQHIVNEPAPQLASKRRTFAPEAREFVERCLVKDPAGRSAPTELLASPWITQSAVSPDDVRAWAQSLDKGE